MCPNFNLLKSYRVYPRKIDFNYMRDAFFMYIYLNPFRELKKAKTFSIKGTNYCFAYQPIYIGKGTGAGYRQHQHITSFLSGKENNQYKVTELNSIKKGMADAAAKGDHTKPWNWKEYQDGWVIILKTFTTHQELLKFEMESINTIGTVFDKTGPLTNKIKNAYKFDKLSTGRDLGL